MLARISAWYGLFGVTYGPSYSNDEGQKYQAGGVNSGAVTELLFGHALSVAVDGNV